jgi:hypothetical protein
MTYDSEKYREKREKVLGIKKRGITFVTIATIVSVCIITGLGIAAIPKTVNFVTNRNLDDAIFKLDNSLKWPADAVSGIQEIPGVKAVFSDTDKTRLIVTFDRNLVQLAKFASFFKQKGLKSTLLNRIGHSQRINTLEEEKEFEAL